MQAALTFTPICPKLLFHINSQFFQMLCSAHKCMPLKDTIITKLFLINKESLAMYSNDEIFKQQQCDLQSKVTNKEAESLKKQLIK